MKKLIILAILIFAVSVSAAPPAIPPMPADPGVESWADIEALDDYPDVVIAAEAITSGHATKVDADGKLVSAGLPTTDNSTINNILAKDSDGHIENLSLDAHLSRSGTTTQTLSVVTPAVTYASSAGTAPTAAQMTGNGVIVSNYGQGAEDVFVPLPTAVSGLSALYTVATAQANHFGVVAAANDKIYLIAAAGTVAAGDDAAAVVMTAAQLGQAFACWTFLSGNGTYDWMCKAVCIGTSTFVAHAAP